MLYCVAVPHAPRRKHLYCRAVNTAIATAITTIIVITGGVTIITTVAVQIFHETLKLILPQQCICIGQ